MRLIKLIVVVISFSVISCKPMKEISVTGIDSFKIDKLSIKEGLVGAISVKIENPNGLGFAIYPSDVDLMYSGMKLGKVKLTKRVKIKAHTEHSYELKLNSDLSGVNWMDITKLFGSDKAGKLEIKGNLKVGKCFVKKAVPINYSDKVKLTSIIGD